MTSTSEAEMSLSTELLLNTEEKLQRANRQSSNCGLEGSPRPFLQGEEVERRSIAKKAEIQ